MTKIFATKALSMVLCFVMLFMGAPVTTWADVDPSDALYFTADANGDVGTAITTGQSAEAPYMLAAGSTIYLKGTALSGASVGSSQVLGSTGDYTEFVTVDESESDSFNAGNKQIDRVRRVGLP